MPKKSQCGSKVCCCTGFDVTRRGVLLAVVAPSNLGARQFYMQQAHALGAEVQFFDPQADMSRYGGHYCGLLVDVPSFIRLESNEKQAVNLIQEILPTVRCRFDARAQDIRIMPVSGWCRAQAGSSFADFIAYCRSLTPRKLRKDHRVPVHLPAVLSSMPTLTGRSERTVTINISNGGCFFSTTGRWKVGNRIWFHFTGMSDPTPIRGVVCWVCPWGEFSKIPGIGVSFESISASQHREIVYAIQHGSFPVTAADFHRKAS